MGGIVARKTETKILNELLNSKSPEFLALYGRRIGKTFRIKNFFKDKKVIFFNITGEKGAPMKKQISHFTSKRLINRLL